MFRICTTTLAFVLAVTLLAACTSSTTTVLMTRHAEKQSGNDPDLTDAGQARALALADFAEQMNVETVISTQFRRTRQTALAAAERLGVEIVIEPTASSIEDHIASLATLIRTEHAGETILVVGHSNTIPLLITALGGPHIHIEDDQYGDVFILSLRDGEVLRFERETIGR